MLIRRRTALAVRKIWIVLLLGVVSIALVIPRGDVALGQSSPVMISATFDVTNSIETDAFGINGSGQIVGDFIAANNSAGASCNANPVPDGCVHGFLRDAAGTFNTIDPPASGFTEALGINDTSQIVGTYTDSNSRIHGFVRDPASGIFTTLDDPAGVNTVAFGINDTGQIVGYFQDNTGYHGFIRDPASGTFATLDDPNGVGKTLAYGINGAGQIVGAFYDTTYHGFLDAGGSFTTIDGPNSTLTQAHGINSNGQIVGFFFDGSGAHGFVTVVGGTFTAFDVPNATSTFALGINGTGQIAGYYGANGTTHGFLANGKPDPVLTVPHWYQVGVPPFSANTSGFIYNNWGSMQLDTETNYNYIITPPLGSATIARDGCVLTALTMVYNFWAGNLQPPPNGTTGPPYPDGDVPPANPNNVDDPTVLNTAPGLFLTDGSGQVTWSFVYWNKLKPSPLVKMYPECPSCNNMFPVLPSPSSPNPTQTLVNILRNGVPVILPIQCDPALSNRCKMITGNPKEIHWVVVTGWNSQLGTFFVNDPGDVNVATLNTVTDSRGNKLTGVPNAEYAAKDGITPSTVQNSLNNIGHWKVYNSEDKSLGTLDATTAQALGVYSNAPVELILTDPQGRRTGFDPLTNTSFLEIPTSDYSSSAYCDELGSSGCNSTFKTLEVGNQIPGQYTLDVVGTGSGTFTISVRASDASGNFITQTYSGITDTGVSSQFTFQGAITTFAALSANVAIKNSKNQVAAGGQFTLGAGSFGINPLTQPVTLQVGAFLITIPTGSFQLDSHGNYVFQGRVNGVQLAAGIQPQGGNQYAYGIAGQSATNLPTTNPIDVRLAIGSDGGDTSVSANFLK